MIQANFNKYASYVTDSLYQWDLNQVLSVSGLNLSVAPEVHFANANMDKAIVKQAELIDHKVKVQIPNSLLQEPLTIKAYIGIYEADTFNIIETVSIPVKPKARPKDYRIETTDEEIYSFEALKNAIANMVKSSDFETDKTMIQARIDNIIAHNNDTNGNTELVDMRVGADGTTYDSAGEAVRTQLKAVVNNTSTITGQEKIKFISGENINLNYDIGEVVNLTTQIVSWYRYAIIDCTEGDRFLLNATGGDNPKVWGFLDSDNRLLAVADTYTVTNLLLFAPEGASKLVINDHDNTGVCWKGGLIPSVERNEAYIKALNERAIDTEIEFITGYNIKLAYSVGEIVNLTPETVSHYHYVIMDCKENDVFILNVVGGENPRAWGFLDENNKLIAVADASVTCTDLVIIAPENATKLIINDADGTRISYKASTLTASYCLSRLLNNKMREIESEELPDRLTILESKHIEEIDEVLTQSSNIVTTLGIDMFRNKTGETTPPNKYTAWPFIATVGDRVVCVYSRGMSHEDNVTPSIFAKVSKNGVIWSIEKEIINTTDIRDTITGKGNDIEGNMIFWDRKGAPGGTDTVHDLYRTSDGYSFELVSSPRFSIVPSHIGDIIYVPTIGLMAFYNTVGDTRSWGKVVSNDNGLTWTQTTIGTDLVEAECPMEITSAYLGDGKIIAIGRKEAKSADGNYTMFQMQSNDYGQTWTIERTNIGDIALSTPSIVYDSDSKELSLYYFQRGAGLLRLRKSKMEDVWDNPTNWSESTVIARGTTNYEDTGNVNAVAFGDIHLASFYSGDSENTGIYTTII